jgi:hypothetical protein
LIDQAIEERIEFTADRSGISLEEAYNAAGDGVTTFAVAVDNSDSTQNKEASNMKASDFIISILLIMTQFDEPFFHSCC